MTDSVKHLPNEPLLRKFVYATIIITLILNAWSRHALYGIGIQIISTAQRNSNIVLDWFFMVITMTIDPLFVFIGVICMVVLSHRKGKGFIMFVFIMFNTFWAALLKAYHCDPRPFWTRDSIKNIGIYCPIQYGNPSGHSWFSVLAGFGVLMQYRGSGRGMRNIYISIFMVIFVPMSRMYLGAHSLNQVLEGLLFGSCLCLLFRLGLKDLIHKFLAEFNHNKVCKMVIIGLHILSIIPFVMHMDEQLPEKWRINIDAKCIKNMNEAKLNQLMLTVNALIINVITGLGLGYEQLVKSQIGAFYLTGRWRINRQKYGQNFGKFLFFAVEVGFMLSGLIGALIIYMIYSTFVMGYIALSIGGLVTGYLYSTRTAKYLQKYDIIKKCSYEKKVLHHNIDEDIEAIGQYGKKQMDSQLKKKKSSNKKNKQDKQAGNKKQLKQANAKKTK